MSESPESAPPLSQRIKTLLSEYGPIALGVYLVLFVLVYLGFLLAILFGLDVGESTTGKAGATVAAWVATKVTQPIRIGGALFLTPIVAKVLGTKRKAP